MPHLRHALIAKIDRCVSHHKAAVRARRQGDEMVLNGALRLAKLAWRDAELFAEEIGVVIDATIANTYWRAYALGYRDGRVRGMVVVLPHSH